MCIPYVHVLPAQSCWHGRCRPGCHSRSGSHSPALWLLPLDASVHPCIWWTNRDDGPHQHSTPLRQHSSGFSCSGLFADISVRERSPLCIFIFHITEPCDRTGQLFPEGSSVPNIHRLIHQHNCRQHLHSDKQLRVGQWTLQDTEQIITS